MEANGGLARKSPGERAEPPERDLRLPLVETPYGRSDPRLHILWAEASCLLEDGRRRSRHSDPLQSNAVQEELAHSAAIGAAPECDKLIPRGQLRNLDGSGERRDERRQPTRELGEEEVAGEDGVRSVWLLLEQRSPRGERIALACPEARQPEVKLHDAGRRVELAELLEAVEGRVRPGRKGDADLRLERVVTRKESSRRVGLPALVEAAGPGEIARLAVVSKAECKRERWPSRARLHVSLRHRPRAVSRGHDCGADDPDGNEGGKGDERDDTTAGAHAADDSRDNARSEVAGTGASAVRRDLVAIVRKVMAGYRQLLARVKEEIDEISTVRANELLGTPDAPLFVDVREPDEWEEGHIPGALYTGRGRLEQRIEGLVPDKNRPLVVYCSAGSRSAFAAKALAELGYEDVVNLAGGFSDWKRNGFDVTIPRVLTPEQRSRYSRHLLIPEVGEDGQQRLLDARILLVGAGGLGSPASLYLAAAGVGTLGIVDADVVDESNLQRQIVHSTDRIGEPKVLSAKRTLEALNPDVRVVPFEERLTSENVERILADGWDVIVDGADNFPTRYLVNDASVWHGIPVVHGSIFPFEGQVTVFAPGEGPCYRCLFPQPPPAELAPSCAEGGVLGVLPGIIGSIQANEALKLVLGRGDSLAGRLLLFDALGTTFDEVNVRRDPYCPVCGDNPEITEYIDYVEFCNAPVGRD